VLAIATFAAFGLYAAIWVFAGLRLLSLGALAAGLALATVFATSMIYAQMKSVPRWRSPTTPLVFLLAALSGGALVAGALERAGWLLVALGLAKLADWITGDRRFAGAGTTLASATGLGAMGRLRMLEPPHTGPNYLTREMVHVVGRAHAGKLRVIGLVLAVLLPLALAGFRDVGHLNAELAVLAHVAGMLVLRWGFFAQAEHVVGLYYGKR
jgi:DMSO reductase anchor subunit